MTDLVPGYDGDFRKKVGYLLNHFYYVVRNKHQSIALTPDQDFAIGHANGADEFELLVDYAGLSGWLTWLDKRQTSGVSSRQRIVYREAQLTALGIAEVEATAMLFDDLLTCPFTGLTIKGWEAFTPLNGSSEKALYTFKPIGQAVFERNHLLGLAHSIKNGNHAFRPDLAGHCRYQAELGLLPVEITYQMFADVYATGPATFDEKRAQFLQVLYETGSNEYIQKEIFLNEDFPLAFARNAEEFSRIFNSLTDEKLLRWNRSHIQADIADGRVARFREVLLTPEGIQKVKAMLTVSNKNIAIAPLPVEIVSASPLAHLHPAVQNAVGSRFTDGYYSDALHKACTALEKAVQDKASQPAEPAGATLMSKVFSKDKPLLIVSANQGEQEGYMFLYRGLAQAIRNHYAHNDTATDPARALEWLGFISALFYKLDEAISPATP